MVGEHTAPHLAARKRYKEVVRLLLHDDVADVSAKAAEN
jgi:hypothetical protein